MRNLSRVGITLIAVAPAATATALGPATAAQAAPSCPTMSSALSKQNAAAASMAKRLLRSTSYTPRVKSFTPRVTSTKGFTGYETIVVQAPKGTTPVVGYFTLRGFEPCTLVVASAGVVLGRDAYVLRLRFPGEQGNPGRVTVTLVSR